MKEALIIGAKFFYFTFSGGEEELFVLKESSERAREKSMDQITIKTQNPKNVVFTGV